MALAAALALGVCLLAEPIGRALRVIDSPDGGRKRHARPTPMVGGLALALPLTLAAIFQSPSAAVAAVYLAVAAAVLAFFVIGFIDDRSHIRPLYRLILSTALVLAVLAVVPEERVQFFRFSFAPVAIFLGNGWSVAFTALCLVGLQNALNMADGRNGLAVGTLLIWSGLLVIYATPHMLPVLGAMMGALAVILVFNLRGRVFLGDSGAYAGSLAVGLLAIRAYGVGFPELHADEVALWFLIPIMDAVRLMVMRVLRGQSPFAPDSGHFHHKLAALMPWPRGLVVYLILVGAPSVLAHFMPALTLLWLGAALGVYGLVLASAALAVPHATTSAQLRLRPNQGS